MESSDSLLNLLYPFSVEPESKTLESINSGDRFSGESSSKVEFKSSHKYSTSEDNQTVPVELTTDSKCSDDSTEVILSVFWKRGKLGAAYYTCADSELHLLNDVVDVRPDFINLKTLVNQVRPSQVVTCGGLNESFLKALSDILNGNFESGNENTVEIEELSKKIFFISGKNKEFSYDACKRQIQAMKLGFEPETLTVDDHVLFINSHIDLKLESMVISLGVLLKYLEKFLPQINLNHDVIQIMFLHHISLENVVSIDENTYRALQIFNPVVHPSAFKRNVFGWNREGLSIFGIFNRCKSNPGLRRMREIFTNPMKNLDELNERLDAVEFCCKPQHQHIVDRLIDCIKKVDNITGILASIYRTRAKITHWRSLYSTLYHSILIGEICETHSSQTKLLKKISKSITPDIHEVTHYINQVIDFEESFLKNHFTVRTGLDPRLDLLKQKYAQIPEFLVSLARIELENLPSFVTQCSIVYITELGYLLSIPIWKGDGTDASEYELPNFEVKFVVNDFVHYKTPTCVELDDFLGDMVASISNIESKIMINLIQFIHTRIKDIMVAVKLIADLDCVIAFAAIACENNYKRPVLTKERKFEIVGGRHPLQELCVDNFVPNDIYFDGQFIKILTGPNASGKSVYLKQVALIAYLAHIGSFVPAQRAVICILDHIHSRVHSLESISTRLSSFLLDLKQMSFSMYNSTPFSLIIIDEFGKGTNEIDGISLLAASLIHFIEREQNCPYLLVSTHFHRLPELLPKTPLVHLQYMEYMIENDEIIYLHKIRDGTSGSSLTLLAAKKAGLSEEAIKRSMEILESSQITPNPNLEVTKTMMKNIHWMLEQFQTIEGDDKNDSEKPLDYPQNNSNINE